MHSRRDDWILKSQTKSPCRQIPTSDPEPGDVLLPQMTYYCSARQLIAQCDGVRADAQLTIGIYRVRRVLPLRLRRLTLFRRLSNLCVYSTNCSHFIIAMATSNLTQKHIEDENNDFERRLQNPRTAQSGVL